MMELVFRFVHKRYIIHEIVEALDEVVEEMKTSGWEMQDRPPIPIVENGTTQGFLLEFRRADWVLELLRSKD